MYWQRQKETSRELALTNFHVYLTKIGETFHKETQTRILKYGGPLRRQLTSQTGSLSVETGDDNRMSSHNQCICITYSLFIFHERSGQDCDNSTNSKLMDSPLNRAHQQERKAEKLISWKKYQEAVVCYEIASAYITEAMKTTTTSQALMSMQLQYEDHLRKQKLLRFKIEKLACAGMKSENSNQTKITCANTINTYKQETETSSSDVLNPETSDCSFDLSLQSSQGVLIQAEDANVSDEQDDTVCKTSIEDLQMQVLSLTQALEDSNRENNHLRNIVIRFKEVLHDKFGFAEEEIEAMVVSQEEDKNTDSLTGSVGETHSVCDVNTKTLDQSVQINNI